MNYIIYDTDTGEIYSVGTYQGEEDLANAPVPSGSTRMLDTVADPLSQRVINGVVVDLAEDVVARRSARPSHLSTWDWDTLEWVDGRTLQQQKDDLWEVIKDAREGAIAAGFTWDSDDFDCDSNSRDRITAYAQSAQIAIDTSGPFSVDWTLADNSVRTLDAQDMLDVFQAMVAHINTQHIQSQALRVDIDQATSSADLEGIVWGSADV